ncbi:TPA: hypothetical protein N0F65_009244 [Lagenidium giganteum]|uniref:SWIM-type domain-containing protein n=1 Tax=Lagenidium giganteum TaxID=4803 RepID=A0AAV2YIL1_9STRA|nr:TPA: hypothetical protein N0F65_009244 [Lagenidium giganteum]
MHYSSSVDEFYAIVQESFHSWSRRPDLLGVAQYFNNQWRLGRFRVWQCFARPAGYATTNNPVEQFNNVLKRDYSLRARLKLGTLVKLIASCVRASSVDTTPLATTSTIPLAIRTRMKILVRANKLVMKPPRLSMSFLLTDTSTQNPSNTEPGVVFVVSCRGSAGIKTGNSTSISYLNAEMESIGQSTWGWKVNLLTKACECKYFMKYRSCVHLYFAINSAAEDERDSEEFVNPNPRRQRGATTNRRSSTVIRVTHIYIHCIMVNTREFCYCCQYQANEIDWSQSRPSNPSQPRPSPTDHLPWSLRSTIMWPTRFGL